MTATINASTSSGVVVTSDTSGSLALQTANTTAMTINSSQVVNFANTPTIGGSAFPSGAMTLISTQTASNISPYLPWTGLSGYNDYMIEIRNITLASAGGYFGIQVGTGAAPTWQTSGYNFQSVYCSSGSVGANGSSSYYAFIVMGRISGSPTSGTGISATIYIRNMNGTAGNGFLDIGSIFSISDDSSLYAGGTTNGGLPTNATTKTSIRLIGDYNITGSASLYGISS
jgi:hypothetical protein